MTPHVSHDVRNRRALHGRSCRPLMSVLTERVNNNEKPTTLDQFARCTRRLELLFDYRPGESGCGRMLAPHRGSSA